MKSKYEDLDEKGLMKHVDLNVANVGYNERTIVYALSRVFLVTFVKVATFKSVIYCYAFLKPPKELKEKYRLQNEILVLINRHENFDGRAFDYVDKLLFEFQNRLDKLCVIFISLDKKLKEKIKSYTQQNAESRIIIPFSYIDFFKTDPESIINSRLKEFFYGRDLFAFESPLQNDTYFYGRNDVVQFFYDKYKSGENCGLFGLRKIGKTSVLFALRRYLLLRNEIPVFIDCQEPSFHKRRWFECLEFIVQSLIEVIESDLEISIKITLNKNYDEIDGSKFFQEDLLKLSDIISNKRILFILDEIENITFDISPTNHWNKDEDFIYFWQSIRAIYQKHPYLFSYLIAGVNPKAIESPTVKTFDNPIYRMITGTYLKFFKSNNVKEMVGTIGNYMGLEFEDEIFTFLTEDFGGHPFLIRQVCSKINQGITKNRPTKVSKYYYQENREEFDIHLKDYIELIIDVLRRWYPNEYHLIELLALDEYEKFHNEIQHSEKIIEHLLGYNIIEKSEKKYHIRISAVKKYLVEHSKIQKSIHQIEDKWKVVTERRNLIEINIRKVVKLILKSCYGPFKAKDEFLKIISSQEKRKEKLTALNLDELFSDDAEIYFEDLRKFINVNWNEFDKIFSDKGLFDAYMQIINKNRIDAHAKDISDENLTLLLYALNWINDKIDAFLT